MVELVGIMTSVLLFVSFYSLYQYYQDYKFRERTENSEESNPFIIKTDQKYPRLWLLDQGYLEGNNILNLISDDEGINWHVVRHGIKNPPILGALEERHREVFLYPFAWEKLKDYVKKNGPITLEDTKAVELLEKAGFEVRTKTIHKAR